MTYTLNTESGRYIVEAHSVSEAHAIHKMNYGDEHIYTTTVDLIELMAEQNQVGDKR